MATSGKKGKKKVKAISLQNFLSNGNTTQPGVTQVAKKVRNRDDSDDDESGALPQFYQLPTAPRANRIFEDDDSVPHKPPFLAYISNLPFDIKEDDIYEFFNGIKIESVRLPREDGEYGRLRGFGYIEFETRNDLIHAIGLPDPQIKTRRIRINVSNENDQKRGSNNRNRYEGFGGSSENKDSTNWRRGGDGPGKDDERRSGYGYRERDRDRAPRDGSPGGEAGSWRTGDRPNIESTSPARRGGGYGERFSGRRHNDEYRNRNDRNDEPPPERERPKLNLQPRTLPLPEIVTQPLDKDSEEESEEISKERAVTPEQIKTPKPTGVSAEKVFGGAKPVDTAAKEKEIEERIEKERLEKLKKKEEENEKEKEVHVDEKSEEKHTEKDEKDSQNTATSWRKRDDDVKQNFEHRKYSPDRRGPPRRSDDRQGGASGSNTRDNRDRRDYNRGGYDRDNRNIDNRDRNERSDRDNYRGRGDRDRGYNKDKSNLRDVRDQRDNRQREDKPKQRENRPEKPMPKCQPPQGGPVLSTSNKYALFQDEDDVTE